MAEGIDDVVVATCDQQIMDVVTNAGGKAIMTSDKHERSTERIAEAMRSLTGDIVVVPQGDEPLLLPEVIAQVAAPFYEHSDLIAASLLSPLEGDADYTNPNVVKAARDQHGYILFYSRAAIPYFQRPGPCPIYRETGVRAFRGDFLPTYTSLPETPFERVESVDMLRLLENGFKILGVSTDYVTIGVDHVEDVAKVEYILKTDPVQQALYEQIVKENL